MDEELLKFAKSLKVPFKDGATAEALIEEFIKSVEK